jgi:hypothetical protein
MTHAADRVIARGVSQTKPMTLSNGTWNRKVGGHPAEPSVPLKGVHRTLKQVFTCHRAAIEEGSIDIWVRRTGANCHRCRGGTGRVNNTMEMASEASIATCTCA